MFTSSAWHEKPLKGSLNYNLRPLPMKGTNRRNPDEDFTLSGKRSLLNFKRKKYRTNSQMTLTRSGTPSLQASVSKTDISVPDDDGSPSESDCDPNYQEHYYQEPYYQGDTAEFDDGPEPELTKLKEDTLYVNDPEESVWYLNPVHRSQSAPLDMEILARKSPLQASVLRSSMEGLLQSASPETIEKTPIESFDLSLFKNAEDEMLSCRTLTALTSPYQYKLAKLRMERLRIEEERLLKLKTLSELERIRGPTRRWYEMKTAGFHVEARKNNQLLASKGHYKEIMNYRHDLLAALER